MLEVGERWLKTENCWASELKTLGVQVLCVCARFRWERCFFLEDRFLGAGVGSPGMAAVDSVCGERDKGEAKIGLFEAGELTSEFKLFGGVSGLQSNTWNANNA